MEKNVRDQNLESTNGVCKAQAGKYLTFMLADEEYGLEILKVKEIIGMMDITVLPQTPDFVKGVINLRGKVIPVIDLRLKFMMPEIGYSEKTCIIVVEIRHSVGTMQIGIIVDQVSEVLNVTSEELEATPKFGVSLDTDFILGMAKSGRKIITLLDIGRVLVAEDILLISENAA
ncbi:MAG: purine-binding chemotaxis protein CheW [Candidatus Latescibacteria bacterium]|nr:purine-binding chemotaxis protein CheW [Candidatus Latescibacterota bacterium]